MTKYNLYEKDGAIFRGKAGAGFVKDIWTSEGWAPYKRDPLAPVTFGDYLGSENDEDARIGVAGASVEKATPPDQFGCSDCDFKLKGEGS